MPPIVSFIGWHNSGKTTLAGQVVRHLKDRGYTVAVIKSSKENGILFDQQGTDTSLYHQAGADGIALVAPDQLIIRTENSGQELATIVHRFFADVDIVIAEGFKHSRHIAKIEVSRGDTELLRDQVNGVIAIATDREIVGDHIFRLNESHELADFLEKRFLCAHRPDPERAVLLVDGRRIVLKNFVQDILANTVTGFVDTLKTTDGARDIELRIRIPTDKRQDSQVQQPKKT